jgi:hypothetical protein
MRSRLGTSDRPPGSRSYRVNTDDAERVYATATRSPKPRDRQRRSESTRIREQLAAAGIAVDEA